VCGKGGDDRRVARSIRQGGPTKLSISRRRNAALGYGFSALLEGITINVF
jgi:hypothetical protein